MTDEATVVPATDEEITAWDQSDDPTHRCATPWRSSCRCALIARIRAEQERMGWMEKVVAGGSWCCGVACKCPVCDLKRAILARRKGKP